MTYLNEVPNVGNTVTTTPAGALVVLLVNGEHEFITPANLLAGFTGAIVAPQALTFAGIAGPPIGNQILWPNIGDVSGAALDGAGNLVLPAASNVQGLFKGMGLQGDTTFTVRYKAGVATKTFMFAFRGKGVAGSTYSGYAIHVNDAAKYVEMFRYGNGAFIGPVGGTQPYTASPVNTVDFVVAGSVFVVRFDGVQVASFTDTTVAGQGYIGVGTSLVVVATPCAIKEIDAA